MKARLVSENISFQRGADPRGSMGIGGLSYDTLRKGAILESTKFFGITESSGMITGYHAGKMGVRAGNYFLVTNVGVPYGKKSERKTFQFRKSQDLKHLKEMREKIFQGEIPGYSFYAVSGFLEGLTKKRFDYRFDIIEPGVNMNESIQFNRGDDPKRTMRIGEKTWNKLQSGDFLRPKKNVKVDGHGAFKPPSYKSGKIFYPEDYVVVITYKNGVVEYNRHMAMGYSMHLRRCWDLEEAMEIRSMLNDGTFEMPRKHDAFNRPIEGSYQQWENRFEISDD